MRKTMKFAAILTAAVISLSAAFYAGDIKNVTAAAQTPIVKLDGKPVSFPDAKPYVNEDDRTLVPVRFVSEALGCIVEWEETRELVTITKAPYRILFRIGENSAIVNNGKSDVKKVFDTKAVLREERTFVPLRFISETLGAGVAWDEVNNTVVIRSDGTVEAVATPTPAPTPTPTPEIPVPTGEPSVTNPIPGNPYYGGVTKEELSRYNAIQKLLQYTDIVSIVGNPSNPNSLSVSYGGYNKYQKRYQGYLSVDASEDKFGWKINISKYGGKEIQRLREVIDIVVPGSQEFRDYIYNTALEYRMTATTELKEFQGKKFFVAGFYNEGTKPIWEDESFFVTIWGNSLVY